MSLVRCDWARHLCLVGSPALRYFVSTSNPARERGVAGVCLVGSQLDGLDRLERNV